MLIRNGRTQFQNPGQLTGSVGLQNGNVVKGGFRNRFVGGLSAIFGGYANGHLAPESFVLPTSAGSISSYTEASATMSAGVIVITAAKPMAASGAMQITVQTATMSLLAELVASGALVLSVSSATLASALFAIANGSMTISGTASLGGIIPIDASGTIVIASLASLGALANMEAEAGGPQQLTAEALANAVWQKSIDGNFTGEEILRVLVAVAAGKTTIADLGGGAATVVFRNLGDALDRVSADMQDSERTAVTLDLG